MRGRSSLSVPQRELIAAFVSALNQSKFCVAEHVENASLTGVNQDVFQQLLADIETAPVRPKLKPLLKFAKKLTLQPDCVAQQDVDAIFEAGWDEKAFRDTVAISALMNLANRLASGFGIEVGRHKNPYNVRRGRRSQG